jgi:hypothetical protein
VQHGIFELDVVPLEAEEFAEPQPGVDGDGEEGGVVVAGFGLSRCALAGVQQVADGGVGPFEGLGWSVGLVGDVEPSRV